MSVEPAPHRISNFITLRSLEKKILKLIFNPLMGILGNNLVIKI